MLRILYVLHKRPDSVPGGSELHTLDLVRGLLERRYHVYLLFPSGSGIIVRDCDVSGAREYRFETEYVGPEVLRNASAEEALKKILDDFRIDIVHFQHLYGLPISFIEIAKDKGRRIAISFHDFFYWCLNYNLINFGKNPVSFCDFNKHGEECYKCLRNLHYKVSADYPEDRRNYIENILARSDIFVAPSEFLRNAFLTFYPRIALEKFTVIEHGTNKPILKPWKRKRINSDTLNIAFLGNFTIEKGKGHYLELINHFRNHEKVHFSIIGHLERHLDERGFQNLQILGGYNREKLPDILQREAIDIIILLSVWPETFSFTLSEAISNSIPVIATDLGALRERISKYMVGYLIPYENPVPRMVQIINDFLRHPELLDFFKERCILAAKELPDIDSMIDKYEELYRSSQ